MRCSLINHIVVVHVNMSLWHFASEGIRIGGQPNTCVTLGT